MTKKELLEDLKDIDDNAKIVISKCFVIDEKESITAILDIPIVGTAYGKTKTETELRFILRLDDVKQNFSPKNLKLFPKEDVSNRKIKGK